jgi:hypothetical protein
MYIMLSVHAPKGEAGGVAAAKYPQFDADGKPLSTL